MDCFSWFITFCIYGEWGSKEGSLQRWPIAQTNQELQMLPGSNVLECMRKQQKQGLHWGQPKP